MMKPNRPTVYEFTAAEATKAEPLTLPNSPAFYANLSRKTLLCGDGEPAFTRAQVDAAVAKLEAAEIKPAPPKPTPAVGQVWQRLDDEPRRVAGVSERFGNTIVEMNNGLDYGPESFAHPDWRCIGIETPHGRVMVGKDYGDIPVRVGVVLDGERVVARYASDPPMVYPAEQLARWGETPRRGGGSGHAGAGAHVPSLGDAEAESDERFRKRLFGAVPWREAVDVGAASAAELDAIAARHGVHRHTGVASWRGVPLPQRPVDDSGRVYEYIGKPRPASRPGSTGCPTCGEVYVVLSAIDGGLTQLGCRSGHTWTLGSGKPCCGAIGACDTSTCSRARLAVARGEDYAAVHGVDVAAIGAATAGLWMDMSHLGRWQAFGALCTAVSAVAAHQYGPWLAAQQRGPFARARVAALAAACESGGEETPSDLDRLVAACHAYETARGGMAKPASGAVNAGCALFGTADWTGVAEALSAYERARSAPEAGSRAGARRTR